MLLGRGSQEATKFKQGNPQAPINGMCEAYKRADLSDVALVLFGSEVEKRSEVGAVAMLYTRLGASNGLALFFSG